MYLPFSIDKETLGVDIHLNSLLSNNRRLIKRKL